MILWAHEHQPVSVEDVATHFSLDPDDAYSELYPLQGIEVSVNDEFHNLGVVIEDDGEIFFDMNPLFGRPRRLERAEALGLLAAANAALRLPGTDVESLKTAVTKLENALGVGSNVAVEITEPEHLDTIQTATGDREKIRIEYYARWTDEVSVRTVEPYETVNVDGDWHLRGHCLLRDDHRTFRIDRIETVELTGENHSRTDPGNQPFTGGDEAPLARIEMSPNSRWMIESLPAQIVEDKERLVIDLPVSSIVFLESLMLRLGAEARIVSDGSFKEVGSNVASRLLARYVRS
mgnify:FL=1|jgi:predicted DNA-binding transcriptional regulator YafY|tara:strand:- start:107 stop:982 length:876 start_codon:yes stop_codon:yes gene_type:complete